jgi:hypothetical protein
VLQRHAAATSDLPARLASPHQFRKQLACEHERIHLSELRPVGRSLTPNLNRHPHVHFHYTPTYSSWLNQVECWFSILTRQALRGVSFTSPEQVRQAIDGFVKVYNEQAAPFEWKKAVVHPTVPKRNYANLGK